MTRQGPGAVPAGPPARGVVCAGGAVLDRHLHLFAPPVPGTSNPAHAATSPGGVARNVAENLALLGVPVRLCTRVGDDDAGRQLLSALAARGIDVTAVTVSSGGATAQYVAVLDPAGDLVLGVAAMDVLDGIRPADLEAAWPGPGQWLFLDCNLPAGTLTAALARARERGTPVAVDAVSTPKVVRLASAAGPALAGVAVLFCNLDEARALLSASALPADGDAPALAARLVDAGARAVVLTRGAEGAVAAGEPAAGGRRTRAAAVVAVPAATAEVVDVTGAGDAAVAATLSRLVEGDGLADAVRFGMRAAALTVASPMSVRPGLAELLRGPAADPPCAEEDTVPRRGAGDLREG